MTGMPRALEEARRQVRRVLDQLESVHWQLLGIQLNLPEPAAEILRLEDVSDEMDPVAELRTMIACVLDDSLRPAIQTLTDGLASRGGEPSTQRHA